MPIAEITYNRGLSYRIARPNGSVVKFKKNCTRVINDLEIIRVCQQTRGFTVEMAPEKPVVKTVRRVARAASEDSSVRTTKKTKKKTKAKKRTKRRTSE